MRFRAALVLASALVLCGPARASAANAPLAYDVKTNPLDDVSKDLLNGSGYEVRDDGHVWDKIFETPVSRDDMPYFLSRLASARRLKALLQINNIITRYDSESHLTPEDKEAVRAIVRQNWSVFGVTPRHDFRSYFSVQELEALDKIPSRYDTMSPVTMTDPLPESVTAEPPPAPVVSAPAVPVPIAAPVPAVPVVPPTTMALPSPVPAVATVAPAAAATTAVETAPAALPAPIAPAAVPLPVAPPPAPPQVALVAAAPAKLIPTLTPLLDMPSLKRPSPFATAPVAAPPPAVLAPTAAPAVPIAPAAAAAPAAPAVPAAALALSSGAAPVVPDAGVLKPWTPPAASTTTEPSPVAAAPAAVVPSTAPASAPTTPAAPEPPKPAVIGAPEYEKFVAAGPYSKEGREMLELIGKRAPDYCLPLLRRTVVGAVPQIVMDGTRTGRNLRAGYSRDAADPLAPAIVALSPGPLLLETKKGMFGGRRTSLLFESPEAWKELGLARPALGALGPGREASVENGEWGAVRVYADGSRRGTYSSVEQAGELLEQVLRLGLARENLDASEYAARRWARLARLMFEARMKEETKQDGFLDPDRRTELRDWLDRPEESDDATVSSWAGSRIQAFDPRRGPPDAERAFDARAASSCGRSALENALAENSRRRAARVGALETLIDAGAIDSASAKAAAQSASDEEASTRRRLLAAPPACPAPDPKRDEALRKSTVLLAEASRAEHASREAKAGELHAR
jgi:hypothetical protein